MENSVEAGNVRAASESPVLGGIFGVKVRIQGGQEALDHLVEKPQQRPGQYF